MRLKIDMCYSCICKACTQFKCPYRGGRCKHCDYFTRKKLHDCDFFEYYKLAPKRLRIVRKSKPAPNLVSLKLDAIIQYLGMEQVQAELHSTYGVLWKNENIIFTGSRADADEFIRKYQGGFESKLIIKPLKIDI